MFRFGFYREVVQLVRLFLIRLAHDREALDVHQAESRRCHRPRLKEIGEMAMCIMKTGRRVIMPTGRLCKSAGRRVVLSAVTMKKSRICSTARKRIAISPISFRLGCIHLSRLVTARQSAFRAYSHRKRADAPTRSRCVRSPCAHNQSRICKYVTSQLTATRN